MQSPKNILIPFSPLPSCMLLLLCILILHIVKFHKTLLLSHIINTNLDLAAYLPFLLLSIPVYLFIFIGIYLF